MTRRLRREMGLAALWISRQLRCPKVSKGRAESPLVRPQVAPPPRMGIDAPTRELPSYGAFICFGRRTEGVQGGTEGNVSPVGCPPKAEMTRSSGKQQAERTAVRAAPIVCPEESPLHASSCAKFVVRSFLPRGMTRRLRRGSRACCPMDFSPASVPEGFQRASGKPFGAPAGAYPCPGGNDAPTTAREQGLQPYGALTLFFRWRKKSVQKKASGTATPGKSPLLPIFERGSSQCRAQTS